MKQSIFAKEMKDLNSYIGKCARFYKKNGYDNIYVIADENPIAEYVVPAFGTKFKNLTTFVEAFEKTSVNRMYCEQKNLSINYISLEMLANMETVENSLFVLLCDVNAKINKWFEILDVCVDKVRNSISSKILIGTVLPKSRKNQADMQMLTESAYTYSLENGGLELTQEEQFYLKLEKHYLGIIESGFERINLLRFSNLLGANKANTPDIDLEKIVQDIFEESKVTIKKEDYCTSYSFIGTKDAACVLIKSAFCTNDSEIYNVVYHNATLADVKKNIFENFSNKLKLVIETESIAQKEKIYCTFSNRKAVASKCFSNDTVDKFEELIYRIAVSFSDNEYSDRGELSATEDRAQRVYNKEMQEIGSYVNKCARFYRKKGYNNIYVIADENPIAEYLVPAFATKFKNAITFVEAFEKTSVNRMYCEQKNLSINYASLETLSNMEPVENSLFVLLCDTNVCDDRWFTILNQCEEKIKASDSNKLLIGAILPKLRPVPNGIKYFAEREYSYYIESVLNERTEAEEFYIQLEKQCRRIVNDGFEKVNLLRFDNLIGANTAVTPNIDFEAMIKQAVSASKVEINKEDYCKNYSILGMRDATCAVAKAAFNAREGHVYNVVYHNTTIAQMKKQIFKRYSNKLSLSVHSLPCLDKEQVYYGFSHLKALHHKFFSLKTMNSYEKTLNKAIESFADLD